MSRTDTCRIRSVGKRRDGGTRFWCLEHRADATAKYGRRANRCRYAHIPPISPEETLELRLDQFCGGVALWGAVPPVYDTTSLPLDRGIHVHARTIDGGSKEIDQTYRAVQLVEAEGRSVVVSELDAIYFMTSSIFLFPTKYIECTHCGHPHLDKDWFSVHPHRSHLCAGCGKKFRDTEKGIGNPLRKIQDSLGHSTPGSVPALDSLNIEQKDYPGGIQIWGSNPAIVWTSAEPEREGIHVHAYCTTGGERIIDDTYAEVTVDGIELDPNMVRVLMAQLALPHLKSRIVELSCPSCGLSHFDQGACAITPSRLHECEFCGTVFTGRGRLRNLIGNPMVGKVRELATFSPTKPQVHDLGLLEEAI